MSKRTYPLTAAVAMGASGMRCPQIIEDPTDRRIPYKIEIAEGYYILHYSLADILDAKRAEFFALPTRERPRSIIISEDMRRHCESLIFGGREFKQSHVEGTINPKMWGIPFSVDKFTKEHIVFCDFEDLPPRGGYIPPMEKRYLVGERGPEPIVVEPRIPIPKYVGVDMARPGSERTVIHITNPGYRDDRIYALYEAEARRKIAAAFQIPEEYLRRDGRKFVYDKGAPQKPEERVYDASAWTGRKPRKPSPDLTPVEAWANLEAAILKEIEGLFEWFRSWTVREYYFDDERILRHKTSLVLALRRKDRDIIRRHIELRNGVHKVESAFLEIGKAVRSAARSFIRLNRQLKKD